jgi:hypothetical protein
MFGLACLRAVAMVDSAVHPLGMFAMLPSHVILNCVGNTVASVMSSCVASWLWAIPNIRAYNLITVATVYITHVRHEAARMAVV